MGQQFQATEQNMNGVNTKESETKSGKIKICLESFANGLLES